MGNVILVVAMHMCLDENGLFETVELDEHEWVSRKMNVVVSEVLEAAGVVKPKGLYDFDILSTISRGRGRRWHLGEVCAGNKTAGISPAPGLPSPQCEDPLAPCSSASMTMSNAGS